MKTMKSVLVILIALLLVVVVINIPSAPLKPEVATVLTAQKESEVPDSNLKKLAQFLKDNKNQEENPEKQIEFSKVIGSYKAQPYSLDFVEAATVLFARKWVNLHLKNLEGKSERERLQGIENLVQFLDELLHSRTSLNQLMISLAQINESFEWIKNQSWSNLSEKRLIALKERAAKVVQEREALFENALDSETAKMLAMIDSYPMPSFFELAQDDAGLFFSSYGIGRIFFDKNATLNEFYERSNAFKAQIPCLKDFSCSGLKSKPLFSNPLSWLRNPVGKDFISSTKNLEDVLKKVEFGLQKLGEQSKI